MSSTDVFTGAQVPASRRRRCRHQHALAGVGGAIVFGWVVVAIAANALAPDEPDAVALVSRLQPPSA
jgi:hypothetical protein